MKTLLRSGEIKFYFYFFPALHVTQEKLEKQVIKKVWPHPNIWCEDQHRLTTKNFLSWIEEKSTILLIFSRSNHNPSSGTPYDKWKQLWKNICIKIIFSHTTYIIISIQLQIKYIWLYWTFYSLNWLNTHKYAMVHGLVSAVRVQSDAHPSQVDNMTNWKCTAHQFCGITSQEYI
jgi:hypothetical protein